MRKVSYVSGTESSAGGERSHLLRDNPQALNHSGDLQRSTMSRGDYADFQMSDLGPLFVIAHNQASCGSACYKTTNPYGGGAPETSSAESLFPGQTFPNISLLYLQQHGIGLSEVEHRPSSGYKLVSRCVMVLKSYHFNWALYDFLS